MVKICSKCGTKNFDNAKYCRQCFKKIKKVPVTGDDPLKDEFDYSYSKGYSFDIAGRYAFAIPGVVSGLISLLFFPLVFGTLALVLGINAVLRSDRLGIIAILLGSISLFWSYIFKLSMIFSQFLFHFISLY